MKTRIYAAMTLMLLAIVTVGIADYLPAMPPATGIFGNVISASPSFQDGYHWDDAQTPTMDERDVPEHYSMPSPMTGYTAGDELDYHWVWVGELGDHVIWDRIRPYS